MVAETVLEKAGTQTLVTYIERRLSVVVELVSLCLILEVWDIETYYEGGGRLRDLW